MDEAEQYRAGLTGGTDPPGARLPPDEASADLGLAASSWPRPGEAPDGDHLARESSQLIRRLVRELGASYQDPAWGARTRPTGPDAPPSAEMRPDQVVLTVLEQRMDALNRRLAALERAIPPPAPAEAASLAPLQALVGALAAELDRLRRPVSWGGTVLPAASASVAAVGDRVPVPDSLPAPPAASPSPAGPAPAAGPLAPKAEASAPAAPTPVVSRPAASAAGPVRNDAVPPARPPRRAGRGGTGVLIVLWSVSLVLGAVVLDRLLAPSLNADRPTRTEAGTIPHGPPRPTAPAHAALVLGPLPASHATRSWVPVPPARATRSAAAAGAGSQPAPRIRPDAGSPATAPAAPAPLGTAGAAPSDGSAQPEAVAPSKVGAPAQDTKEARPVVIGQVVIGPAASAPGARGEHASAKEKATRVTGAPAAVSVAATPAVAAVTGASATPAGQAPPAGALASAAQRGGPVPSAGAAPTPAPAPSAVIRPLSPASAKTRAPAPRATPVPVAPVTVRAIADAWIEVLDPAGNVVLSRLLHAGESWTPPRPGLWLTTGNAGGTELVVNGVAGPALGASGAVVHMVPLDAARLKHGLPLSAGAAKPG